MHWIYLTETMGIYTEDANIDGIYSKLLDYLAQLLHALHRPPPIILHLTRQGSHLFSF